MTRKPADSQSHREITDLLPWYVNGTLPPDKRESVAAHLAECADCLSEARMLQTLCAAVEESNESLPFPADDGLDALLSRIGREEESRRVRSPAARLKQWWAALPTFARWALAAQAVAVVALAFASAALLQRSNLMEAEALRERRRAEALQAQARGGGPEPGREQEGPESPYEALSGPQAKAPCAGVRITVVFREDATEKKMRELLTAVRATILDGPTAARFYELCVVAPPGADAKKLADEALARLRGRADVVRLAEPLP